MRTIRCSRCEQCCRSVDTEILPNQDQPAFILLGCCTGTVMLTVNRQPPTANRQQVAETCQLALQKMQYLEAHPDANNEESPYYSVDPTPALPASTPVAQLKETLLDENARCIAWSPSGPHLSFVMMIKPLPLSLRRMFA